MDQGLIPRRYAKALYEVGEQRSANEQLYTLMESLSEAFAQTPGLSATVANPFVSNKDKTSLLTKAVYGDSNGKVNATYADLLRLLEKNGRTAIARDIAIAFVELYRAKNSIYRVRISSAVAMGKTEKTRLESIISRHIGKGTMEYDYSVEPSLIGGFTVTVNSERLDASVSNELKQLRLSLIK